MKGLIKKILKEELLVETTMPDANLIIDIINNTISAGDSKSYDDLFLDSKGDTAVGILHFTKRGLKRLYKSNGY